MDDSIFGLSGKALQLSEDRAVILTNNLVNSATPHYKARDIDFYKLLKQNDQSVALDSSHTNDISTNSGVSKGEEVDYRIPMQKSMDGNTVDEEIERKDFLENAIQYQVNLTFVQNESAEMMKALKGE